MSVTFKDLQKQAEKKEDNYKIITIDIDGKSQEIKIKRHVNSHAIELAMADIRIGSFLNNRFSPVRYTVVTQLAIITLFTDIRFTEKERAFIFEIYDVFDSLGLYQKIIDEIDPEEYKNFIDFAEQVIKNEMQYKTSLATAMSDFMTQMPTTLNEGAKSLEKLSPDNLKILKEMYSDFK